MQISSALDATTKLRFLPEFREKIAMPANASATPNHKTKMGALGIRGSFRGKTEEGAVVEIVSVEATEVEPGVTLAGENTH